MKTVDPRRGRARINESSGALEITIPARKRVLYIVSYAPMVLISMVLGGVLISYAVASVTNLPDTLGPLLAVFVFALAWLLISSLPVFTLLWMFWGREVVVFNGDGMTHRRCLFGLGTDRRYDLVHMRRLRVVREIAPGWGMRSGPFTSTGQMIGISGGSLAFDYGMKTPHFGAALDDAEAAHIREEICKRAPTICA
ncbi:hypothetical protein [Rhodobium gokarnense]|uniref:DUF304 domain-containing protein n=1 Tax=Rhodobium gokarnense TaxID=364296 RepID=A0ABT3HIP3_9HYPH|nr:hypothetical protein [Rhodobium gokarnense]MCW2310273.1 hypothetical protein [Rhodobium gokarnense]